jgi:tripartite-type tricarboxylate transporter receptor subunit TctC
MTRSWRLRPAILAAVLVAVGFAPLVAAGSAAAQTYPWKPIRIIVGFAPGGPADVMARLLAPHMSVALGQPVVVDNRPGAGGTIAARAAAESEPDGHTLLLGNTSTLAISPLIYKNIGYDPLKAFAPVARLGTTSNIMMSNSRFPPASVRELITYAKTNPGKLNYSSAGIGTPPHLIGEMFKLRAGVDAVHVPYRGGGPSIQAVIAGDVQYTFENPASAVPFVQAGTVRGLAVTSETRHSQLPELPTMIESGLADFVSVSFTGVVAPAGTPAPIVNRLNAVINETLKTPDISATLVKLAVDAKSGSSAEFSAFLVKELERLAPVVKAAGIVGE